MGKADNKKIILKHILFYLWMTGLALIRAIAMHTFIVPNSFAPGGVSGLSSILYNAVLPYNESLANGLFNPAITVFVLNLPLFVLAFLKLNKQFAINTIVCTILYSAFLGLFSAIDFPVFKGSTYESGIMLLAAVAGGVVTGLCLGVMLKLNYSLGGSDIVGRLLYKKNPMINVAWLIFICDCAVVVLSGALGFIGIGDSDGTMDILVRVLTPVFYSFISLFVNSKVADVIQTGFSSSVVFNIVTSKPKEMSEQIVKQVKRGATIIKGVGVYTHEEREILICVISKKQTVAMKKVITEVDEGAFIYITGTTEVNGRGFTRSLDD